MFFKILARLAVGNSEKHSGESIRGGHTISFDIMHHQRLAQVTASNTPDDFGGCFTAMRNTKAIRA